MELARLPHMVGENGLPCIVYIHQIGVPSTSDHFAIACLQFLFELHAIHLIGSSLSLVTINTDCGDTSFLTKEI